MGGYGIPASPIPTVRDAGFEPAVSAWKADVLPLTPITRKTQALPNHASPRHA